MPLTPSLAAFVTQSAARGVTVRPVAPADFPAISRLHDTIFGPGALARTAYRIREGLPKHTQFCRVAHDGATLIGFIRFAPILIGSQGPVLLLGPLAVAPAYANQGHARRLIAEGLLAAEAGGIGLVILVGDVPHYGRLGFVPVKPGVVTMPGPVDPARLLGYELVPGALQRVSGMIGRQADDLT